MSLLLPFLHFSTIAIAIVLPALGVSFGQALLGLSALKAIDRQPRIQAELTRTLLVSMALTETASVIGLALAAMLLFGENPEKTLYSQIAEVGIGIAIGLPGLVIGIATALPGVKTIEAIARQPFFARRITNIMLITQSIGQTGVIFGFIVALFIRATMGAVVDLTGALKLLASGLAIGLGAIGPALGLGLFAQKTCENLGYRPQSYTRILTFTFISEAIIETPLIFALLISLLLLTQFHSASMIESIAFLSAALVIGIGTFSPGINSARVAQAAATQISYSPEEYSQLSRLSLIGQTLIDTSALYALLIALLIIFMR